MANKMKSKKAAKKRFKLTATGKVKFKKMNKGHIMTKKSPKRVRNLRAAGYIAECDAKNIRKDLLPYG
ncbi:MAG: 50S ribosomal protein L35 [Spirochaetaceae bacterium]|nr:50S ribosomal protein L35 [Spirochaetaceae bacterium]